MQSQSLYTNSMSDALSAGAVCESVLHRLEGYLSTRGFGTQAMHDVDKALDRILQGSGLVVLEHYISEQVMHRMSGGDPELFRARSALEQEFRATATARIAIRKINDIIDECASNPEVVAGW